MANNAPVFPMPEPHHFSDYGFDPQIDYFQVLEEARRHERESSRSIDSIHFKLRKPISRDVSANKIHRSAKKRWWKRALLFFKWKWVADRSNNGKYGGDDDGDTDVHRARARAFRASISGPVYVTESRSGPGTPYHTTATRPASGPLAGTLTPTRRGDVEIPYLSLRELTMGQPHRIRASAVPIYLVT